jgi:hypothetical protein
MVARLLRSPERLLADFSKSALKLLDNQADFDSAIPWFESRRPSQTALHTRLGASGFDRRFGGLVAGKGCTVVFFHGLARSSSWLDSAYPR